MLGKCQEEEWLVVTKSLGALTSHMFHSHCSTILLASPPSFLLDLVHKTMNSESGYQPLLLGLHSHSHIPDLSSDTIEEFLKHSSIEWRWWPQLVAWESRLIWLLSWASILVSIFNYMLSCHLDVHWALGVSSACWGIHSHCWNSGSCLWDYGMLAWFSPSQSFT